MFHLRRASRVDLRVFGPALSHPADLQTRFEAKTTRSMKVSMSEDVLLFQRCTTPAGHQAATVGPDRESGSWSALDAPSHGGPTKCHHHSIRARMEGHVGILSSCEEAGLLHLDTSSHDSAEFRARLESRHLRQVVRTLGGPVIRTG